jgi:hypothetical protein
MTEVEICDDPEVHLLFRSPSSLDYGCAGDDQLQSKPGLS